MDAWVAQLQKRENKVRTKKEIYILVAWISTVIFVIFTVVFVALNILIYCKSMMYETSPVRTLRPEWYGTTFPEEAFPVPRDFVGQYEHRVKKGRAVVQTKKFVVCGLVRDILPKLKDNLVRVRAMFADLGVTEYRIVIFENDSKDGSREYLEWEASRPDSDLELVPCFENCLCQLKTATATAHGPESFERLDKMARFRNRLLLYIKSRYEDWADYVLNFDMDVSGPTSFDGFAHNFSFDGWDMMGTYSVVDSPIISAWVYYDSFAYEPANGSYDSEVKNKMLKTLMLRKQRGTPPILVKSAFGGAAIYSMRSLRESRALYSVYRGRCEHVGLHKAMADRGFAKFFINPGWMTLQTPTSFLPVEK